MEREMLNINGNLVGEIKTTEIDTKEGEKEVANFTIVRKNKEEGKVKKEYIYCNLYGEKAKSVKEFKSGEYIHIFGYFKETKKEDKIFKNFIVKHINKIEKKEKKEEI
ncbi:TPA: single-stranded DNA-binding protein [Enterococcus faecium]|nr:single-stranded DNA-binding protein [Enterococcus faecium]